MAKHSSDIASCLNSSAEDVGVQLQQTSEWMGEAELTSERNTGRDLNASPWAWWPKAEGWADTFTVLEAKGSVDQNLLGDTQLVAEGHQQVDLQAGTISGPCKAKVCLLQGKSNVWLQVELQEMVIAGIMVVSVKYYNAVYWHDDGKYYFSSVCLSIIEQHLLVCSPHGERGTFHFLKHSQGQEEEGKEICTVNVYHDQISFLPARG